MNRDLPPTDASLPPSDEGADGSAPSQVGPSRFRSREEKAYERGAIDGFNAGMRVGVNYALDQLKEIIRHEKERR